MVEKAIINLENYQNLIFGKNIYLQDAFIDSRDQVIIQNNVFFGWGVKILTGTHDFFKEGRTRQTSILSRPVLIEEGVWVASFSIVLPGSTIGKNSIVSAGSVLHGIFEPNSFIAGNPAQTIRKIRKS
jgi:acetyltransferase-like isoleucine patch superfamily enzyme